MGENRCPKCDRNIVFESTSHAEGCTYDAWGRLKDAAKDFSDLNGGVMLKEDPEFQKKLDDGLKAAARNFVSSE